MSKVKVYALVEPNLLRNYVRENKLFGDTTKRQAIDADERAERILMQHNQYPSQTTQAYGQALSDYRIAMDRASQPSTSAAPATAPPEQQNVATQVAASPEQPMDDKPNTSAAAAALSPDEDMADSEVSTFLDTLPGRTWIAARHAYHRLSRLPDTEFKINPDLSVDIGGKHVPKSNFRDILRRMNNPSIPEGAPPPGFSAAYALVNRAYDVSPKAKLFEDVVLPD